MVNVWKMNEMFDERYFSERAYFAYKLELKQAIQDLYYKILYYVSRHTNVNMLNGKGKRALDIGCAFGYVADLLMKLKYEVVGLDISTYAIHKAHETSVSPNFLVSDACHIPFKNNAFSLITCFELLEHIPNPQLLMDEIETLLKRDGICIWTTPVRGPVQILYDKTRGEKTHISLFKPNEAEKLIQKYFKKSVILTHLLLPIPPQIVNKYFLLHNTPVFMSSGVAIASVKTEN